MDRFTISILVMICILSLTVFSVEILFHQQTTIVSSQSNKKSGSTMIGSDRKITDQKPLQTVAQKSFQVSDQHYSVNETTTPNAEPIQLNPVAFATLAAGQEVEFLIPQQSRTYTGIIEKVSSASSGSSRIANGQLIQYYDSEEPATFSIISDDQVTYISIRTGSDAFQIEFNNDSGKGNVIELQDQQQSEQQSPDNELDSNNPDLISPSPQESRESFFDS